MKAMGEKNQQRNVMTKSMFPQVPLTLNAVGTQGRKQACIWWEGKIRGKVGAHKSEVRMWCLKVYNVTEHVTGKKDKK